MSTIKIERFIKSSPSEIYTYFTNSTALRDWMCDIATSDPHPNGHLYMGWSAGYYTSGEFVKLVKDKLISFIWHGRGEPHKTLVTIKLFKQDGGTLIKLNHQGMGKGKKWDGIAETFEKEWQSGLDNLTSVLEAGPDLRITRRPMIGISVGEYNPAIASQLGIPVDYGLRLSGVLEAMGAYKAGLQADDVIVAVDGQELTTNGIFNSIMTHKHAGDQVDITYYRASERRSTLMTLSGRPVPTMPSSCKELSEQLAVIYHQYEDQIVSIIKDSTNQECLQKPAPDEWSVNEILAHLIHSEVGWQNVMSEIITGDEASYDGFGGNLQARIDGTVDVYQNKDELFKSLKNHDAETLSMITHIPDEFRARKGKFWKLVFQASQNPYHLDAHLMQIRNAINASQNN